MPPRETRRWLHRLGLGRPRPDESAALEVEHHLAELTDRLISEGSNPEDARHEAERRFGDRRRYLPRMRRLERARRNSERVVASIDLLRQSLRSAMRTAGREPGFAAAVIVTLGLGVGANATMYGIIDRLLLSAPAHIAEPERVRRVLVERPGPAGDLTLSAFISYRDYSDLRAHRGLASTAAYVRYGPLTVGSGESAAFASVAVATAELFPLLGVQPSRGRFYTREEAQPGADPTAVIGFDYWRTVYASDPDALGRAIEIEGVLYTIVGVAPPDFTGVDLRRVDVWLPHELTQALHGGSFGHDSAVQTVARLTTETSVGAAEAEATSLHLGGRKEMIDAGRYSDRARIVLGPLIAARGAQTGGTLSSWDSADLRVTRWLSGVSLIVLLVACANVANLFMARSTRRRQEVDVRLALGAGRASIVVHAALQALVPALTGGALALLIARWGGEVVRSTLFPDIVFPSSAITARVVLFALLAAIVGALSAGVLPALHSPRHAAGLRRDGLGASPRRSALRSGLTVFQAAMTVALLVGAGLFSSSLHQLRSLDLGLDVDRLAMAFLQFPPTVDTDRQTELVMAGAELASALPGVEVAAATTHIFGGGGRTAQVRADGFDSIPRLAGGGPYMHAGTPELFVTMGLAVTRGRGFEPSDVPGSERVAVVSETMASTFWPDRDPIDQCLYLPSSAECAYRVVGVVEDAARDGFRDPPSAAFYVPAVQTTSLVPAIYVRARGNADEVVDEVARALRSLSPDVRSVLMDTVRDRLDPQARSWTLGATMFTIFGLLALIVAAVGLYSVLAFDVAQRTREIGIRTALGARKPRLLRNVVSRGVLMGGVGIALGLAVAYIAAPYIQDLLFETSPRDPAVFATVALILLAVSVAASLVPAHRATRVDPVTALRAD